MNFYSILYKQAEDIPEKQTPEYEAPVFFTDLNLDQVTDTITSGKEEYDLKPFFYAPLQSVDAVRYRHEVMKDLEKTGLYDRIKSFAQNMHSMRGRLAEADKFQYKYQKERLFLEAAEIYCDTVNTLMYDLSALDLSSRGFLRFREYLAAYTGSPHFTSLLAETKSLLADLSSVKYCVHTRRLRIQVIPCKPGADYSEEVEQLFEKFKQEAVKDYRVEFSASPEMNHVEAAILTGVAQLYPDIFQRLDDYFIRHRNYLDTTIAVFDREIQFYLAILEHINQLKQAGLLFCYPEISDSDKNVLNQEGFDLALAYKLVKEKSPVVCNDFYLAGRERIIIVSGPNQGGKTTFSRTFGQLHYMANIGCPVPGREAKLFLFDKMFTHFEKEENMKNLHSKMEDDLIRIHYIMSHVTSRSIVIMNEILSSTTLQDAIFLSKKVMEKISSLDLLCVWVTFIEELISFSEKTVSMTSMVETGNTASRTFKIVRRPADGLAHALSIAEKHRVTYNALKERIRS